MFQNLKKFCWSADGEMTQLVRMFAVQVDLGSNPECF